VSASQDWQPIATAPRDGTVIDLWHKDGFRMTDNWWNFEEDGEGFWTCLLADDYFTHWKPITDPCSAEGAIK